MGYRSNAGKRSAAVLRSKDKSDRATVEQVLHWPSAVVLQSQQLEAACLAVLRESWPFEDAFDSHDVAGT